MNGLTIFEENGKLLTDSREVAKIIDKQHKNLLADIRRYIKYLNEGGFIVVDFFIESTYKDSTGCELPCYLLSKKGCDFVANEMTGAKGAKFTAIYTNYFNQYEQDKQKGSQKMSALEIKEVNFLGDTLVAARDAEGNIWAGVRWICEGIGLSEDRAKYERQKIQQDLVLSKGGRYFTLPTKGGNQAVLCLQLDFVPLWLAKISITPTMIKESPKVVEKIVNYQMKAKDVLAAAFILPTRPMTQAEILVAQAQMLVDMERSQKEMKQSLADTNRRIDDIHEIVALDPNSWRPESEKLISKIAQAMGGHEYIKDVKNEIYALVDIRARCSLSKRLTNKRNRMAGKDICRSQWENLNKVDIIAEDKKLIEIYLSIVKEMAIKNGVGVSALNQ